MCCNKYFKKKCHLFLSFECLCSDKYFQKCLLSFECLCCNKYFQKYHLLCHLNASIFLWCMYKMFSFVNLEYKTMWRRINAIKIWILCVHRNLFIIMVYKCLSICLLVKIPVSLLKRLIYMVQKYLYCGDKKSEWYKFSIWILPSWGWVYYALMALLFIFLISL